MSNKNIEGTSLDEKQIQERIEKLRQAVLADNKLKNCRTDDAYLLRFLHCTDFDVPAAIKRIQDFRHLLFEHPEWFASSSPLSKKERMDENIKAMLQERDKHGRRIFVVKLGKLDASRTNPSEQTELDEYWFESVMDEPETQAKGVSVILDMKGYSWKLFKWLTPSNLKISTTKADLYPCKEIVYHVVNTSFLFNASVKLMWPFLTNKIKEKIKFHFENWPSLHEFVDPSILPEEYGGTSSDIDFEKLNQWLYDQNEDLERRLKHQRVAQM